MPATYETAISLLSSLSYLQSVLLLVSASRYWTVKLMCDSLTVWGKNYLKQGNISSTGCLANSDKDDVPNLYKILVIYSRVSLEISALKRSYISENFI